MGKTRCCKYDWWREQQGHTVRVTKGAFARCEGRLNALGYAKGGIAIKGHGNVWVIYADLEVVDA